MEEQYRYNKFYVLMSHCLLAAIPLLASIVFILIGEDSQVFLTITISVCYLILFSIMFRMIIVLRTRILIDDNGITHISPLKKRTLAWSQIMSIRRKNYYGKTSYPYKIDSRWNLEIKAKRRSNIILYHFLNNIKDLAARIEMFIKIDDYTYISKNYIVGDETTVKLYWLRVVVVFSVALLIIWFMMSGILIKLMTTLIVIVLILLMTMRFKKPRIWIMVEENGILLTGPPFRKGEKYLEWEEIRKANIVNEQEGPLVIETYSDKISLWNPDDIKDNFGLLQLMNKRLS